MRARRRVAHVVALLCAAASSPGQRVVECRVLGIDGQPVANETIGALFVVKSGAFGFRVKTDAAGRLRIQLPKAIKKVPEGYVRLHRYRDVPSAPAHGARRVALADTGNEILPLGDVRLAREPLLASGLVVDPEGLPVVGVKVRASVGYGRQTTLWNLGTQPFFTLEATTSESGKFELRGVLTGRSRFEFSAAREGWQVTKAPGHLKPGAKDTRILMARTSVVHGQVVGLRGVRALPGTTRLDPAGAEPDPLRSTDWLRLDEQGRFRMLRLAGTYTFRFYLPGNPKPDVVIAGIRVEAGKPCRDPRLGSLNLTKLLRIVKLRVLDANDKPMPSVHCTVHRWFGGGRGARHPYLTDLSGVAFVPVPPGGGRVSVFEHGRKHRLVRFDALKEDRTVRLARAWRVRVRIEQLPELPKTTFLEARVRRAWSKRADDWGHVDTGHPAILDHAGNGTLEITHPGPYRVFVNAIRADASGKRGAPYPGVLEFPLSVSKDEKRGELQLDVKLFADQLASIKGWK